MAVYRPILLWGLALWVTSTVVGAAVALVVGWPVPITVVTANDAAAILLLLPWFVGSVLSYLTRPAAMQGTMEHAWQGASHEAVQRDAAEVMSGSQWVGSFAARTALMAVVVLVLDLILRLALGVGWVPLPLLG